MGTGSSVRDGLPASWYHDSQHYARELEAIWETRWLCVGHSSEWPHCGDWQSFSLGDQQVMVTRTSGGDWQAFHNSSRHGDSALNLQQQSLYPVAVRTWRGFVFINISAGSGDTPEAEFKSLQAWPLESLAIACRDVHDVACNWKIFWENYQECYHCPGTHPALSNLVPLYGQGVTRIELLPQGQPAHAAGAQVRPGAITWSFDGQTPLPHFHGLGETERAAGMTFADFLPSMFLIAHVDYVRSVRVWPTGPEQTRLTVDWYLDAAVLSGGNVDIERLAGFARQVVREDAQVCEINQRGLRSRAHQHGLLLSIEKDVAAFDDWVRNQLDSKA